MLIEEIGIGGSALRVETPRDVDIFIYCKPRKGLYDEWFNFRASMTVKGFRALIKAYRKQQCQSIKTVKWQQVLNLAKENLLKIGVKQEWIDYWLPWARVEDLKLGLDTGTQKLYFDLEDLIARYIKHGWRRRPKLEIHVKVEGRISTTDIPYLIVWKKHRLHQANPATTPLLKMLPLDSCTSEKVQEAEQNEVLHTVKQPV